jgi:hypothetical protein
MRGLWFCAVVSLFTSQPLRVVVNLPAFRVDAYVGDSVVQSSPIAIGMRGFRTPRGEFAITSVDWNPWWIPPDRAWAKKEKPTPPGPANPMGRVKLNFQPLYFVHGTPLPQSIGTAASHGCLRMKNDDAIQLAQLVQRFGAPAWIAEEVDDLSSDTITTRTVVLAEPVPIEIRYDLAELRAGRVFVYRDVYNLTTRSLRAELFDMLARRGLDTSRVDSLVLRKLIRRVAANGNSVSIDSLLPPSLAARFSSIRAPFVRRASPRAHRIVDTRGPSCQRANSRRTTTDAGAGTGESGAVPSPAPRARPFSRQAWESTSW